MTARLQLDPEGRFALRALALNDGSVDWPALPTLNSSPIRFTLDATTYNANTAWTLASQSSTCAGSKSCTLSIHLLDAAKAVRVTLDLDIYSGQPVLRHSVRVTNLKSTPALVTSADMLPYSFGGGSDRRYRVFRVNQWTITPRPSNFNIIETALAPTGTPVVIQSGAHGVQCSWLAVRDQADRGFFAGWEFDGRATGVVRQFADSDYIQLSAAVLELHHPVEAGGVFQVPPAFIGIFEGDWDEAGYRTQRFVETALARQVDDPRFPYVSWDSWAYGDEIDENILKMEAWRAAQLGVEVFLVDLGWARRLGDWEEDPEKFPTGLKAVAGYVHRAGMKLGMHFAFAEADPESQVLKDNPDWTSSETYHYYGGLSLCLSNKPTREWIVEQAIRFIDLYNVDWILQDGENMVKRCTKTTHTHHPLDSNYSNAVDGLNWVVAEIQRRRPHVMWENCEDGGNMMTFNMVKYYVTSITNDASGAPASREAVYGATFPFPPRYTVRYQPENFLNRFITRSYMFGGPWHLMNRLLEMTPEEMDFAASEIAIFKAMRGRIRNGKVYHLSSPSDPGPVDAIQSYFPDTDSSIAIVCKERGAPNQLVKLKGFRPDRSYSVTFQDDPRVLTMTGRQIMETGISVRLAQRQDGAIVYVQPVIQ